MTGGNGAPAWGIPAPAPPRSPVRWGIGDFVLAWIVGIVGATVAVVPFVGADGTVPIGGLIASLVGQSAAMLAYLLLIAHLKGRGSLGLDFGLGFAPRDLVWTLVGLGSSLGLGILLLPISELAGSGSGQEVVKDFERSQGFERVLFALGVVLLAPLLEELVYRGLLLRSLLRRTTPAWAVFVSAVVFGLAHVVLDPGAYTALPALVVVGVVAAVLAVRSGRISRSICFHAGFNLLTTIQIFAVLRLHPF